MNDYIIKTQGLTKLYSEKRAIDNLSINVNEGALIGLIGRNGSGKTTFMKLCAGLLDKSSGDISVLGGEPMDNLPILQRLVYTYHNVNHDKNSRLIEIIDSFNAIYQSFDIAFALKLAKYFDLNPRLKYKQLSQGMGSIFNFICAIACRSKLTMLDEPVLGMDVTVRKAAYEVLLRDYTEFPRTIMVSSHLLAELEGILSEIILIDNGKLVFYKDIDEVRDMAYRVDGNKEDIQNYCNGKDILFKRGGDLGSFNIISGNLTDSIILEARQQNVSLSKVRPEDLCAYLTQENKEGELECLWKK